MKVLFIGDVVGNVGRQMIEDYLYRVRKDYQIDFVIANVENATHGKGTKIRVTTALGCVFMDNRYSNPFDQIDDYLNLEQDIHIIDIHAEATSEKIGLAYYCKDKVQAVLGTHTHVQTADERIIDGQVAFISDAGMTGPYLSSLGCDLDSVITRMRGLSSKFLISENSGQFAGVVIEFNDKHQPISIERVLINDDHPYQAS